MRVDARTDIEIESSDHLARLSLKVERSGVNVTADLSDDNLVDLIEILSTIQASRKRGSK